MFHISGLAFHASPILIKAVFIATVIITVVPVPVGFAAARGT